MILEIPVEEETEPKSKVVRPFFSNKPTVVKEERRKQSYHSDPLRD